MIATAKFARMVEPFTTGGNLQHGSLLSRQHSSGEKQRLIGITKRGDPYLRMLLIHGARSVYRAAGKQDGRNRWIVEKQQWTGTTKACVAVADKNARGVARS